jgi:hypothetical protein
MKGKNIEFGKPNSVNITMPSGDVIKPKPGIKFIDIRTKLKKEAD